MKEEENDENENRRRKRRKRRMRKMRKRCCCDIQMYKLYLRKSKCDATVGFFLLQDEVILKPAFFGSSMRRGATAISLVRKLSSLGSTSARPFPDYSPKKPTIKDSELIYHISTAIKQRRFEPFRRILRPFESRFRQDHLIWVLMSIKSDYKLVLDFFDWSCLRKDPSLEARCIVIQLSVAAKDSKMAHRLIHDFWTKPHLDVTHSFDRFVEKLIYTYKDWGSNPYVFDILFQVLVEVGILDEARKLFVKIFNYGLVLSVDSCNKFLSCLSHNVDWIKMVFRVYKEFFELGVRWNTTSQNIMIHSLCQIGKIKEAHNLLLQMEFRGCIPDVISYSTVINGYCNNGELQIVLKIIEDMQIKGLKPNTFTLNSIILLLCKTGKVADAERVLREMMCEAIVPDNVVYTTLIDGFCKAGNVMAAYRLLDEMQSQNIIPDRITYTALICGLCDTGKIEEANKLFDEMHNRGLETDEVTYTALLDGYCKAGEMKKAFWIHNQMVQMGLRPNIVTYTALADGLCKQGELDAANELLHEMREKGLELNICTYNSFVNGLCKAGNIGQAIKLVEDMEVGGIPPDTFTYTTLMDAYCKSGEMAKAHELLRQMLDRGIKPTVVTFNVLMNGFCTLGMLEDGERLLKWMLEKGISPNATTYNSLMKQYSIKNNMRATTEIYRRLCGQGVMPNDNTYNILIRGHCKARNMKEAWFLHKEMVMKGFNVTVDCYNALIKGFFRRKKYSEAKELFEKMRREGLVADRELYNIFVEMNYEEGNVDMTLELCDEAIEKFKSLEQDLEWEGLRPLKLTGTGCVAEFLGSLVFTDAPKIAQWYCWLALGFGAGGVKGAIPIDVIQKSKKEWEVANGSNKLYGLTVSLVGPPAKSYPYQGRLGNDFPSIFRMRQPNLSLKLGLTIRVSGAGYIAVFG
ncbi:hypothetical protein LguiA_009424 [Lonicera macranthoides]